MSIVLAFLLSICSAGLLLAVIIAGISRHKKSGMREVKVIGAPGLVDAILDPEGTVIVAGELWRARSSDEAVVNPGTKIKVVGLDAHLLLVDPMSDEHRQARR